MIDNHKLDCTEPVPISPEFHLASGKLCEIFTLDPLKLSGGTMKTIRFASSLLAVSLAVSTPTITFAHVGHGDEFQSTGGTQRVKVNAENDQMLGITVTPIAPSATGGAGVMIPATALVDADGKQLVFVQYENFYEPVDVKTGKTQGELIEITQGLSVGEKLVTQGGLSLYAESRKTQAASAESSQKSADAGSSQTQSPTTHAQADAQGLPHSHDSSGNMAQKSGAEPQQAGGLPMGPLALGGGAAVVLGMIGFASTRKKKGSSANKNGGV
jgi:membrane fusion protein, cation efflux system